MTGLGTGIADRGAGVDAAGARDCARSRQYCFEKSGFTALERAHQRDAPWTSGTSDVLSHFAASFIWSSARDWVGKGQCSARPKDLASAKRRCGALSFGFNRDRPSARHCKAFARQRRVFR
jgi:hypothetical protein